MSGQPPCLSGDNEQGEDEVSSGTSKKSVMRFVRMRMEMRIVKIMNIWLRNRRWEWSLTHQMKLIYITQHMLKKRGLLCQKETPERKAMKN